MEGIDFTTKAIEMKKITKIFGELKANDGVDLTVHKGEVHALLGENGAGKTTLMNILYGLFQPTDGKIFIKGEEVNVNSPNIAIEHGIGMVHQHFMLVKPFTVVQNIILGCEIIKNGCLDLETASKKVLKLSEMYGLHVEPEAKIRDISVGMQQRVEILKALYRGADILILDEPTAVLTPQEIQELMKIIKNLSSEGKTMIIITHKLKEIKMIADYCTIIRNGTKIDTVEVNNTTEEELAKMMVGREVNFRVSKKKRKPGKTVLSIEKLNVNNNRGISIVNNLSLSLQQGEILGIAGVDGNGQTELVEAITGLRPVVSGKIMINGNDITHYKPKQVIDNKISLIPEDRQNRGLVLDMSVAENMILENYAKEPFSRNGILNYDNILSYSKELITRFDIRPQNESLLAGSLSGGNQQKVIIAREISNNPDVLIAFQPTRGLDVGAIEYVHKALLEQRDRGKAVLLVSLDLEEIMNISDRITVIYEGEIVGVVDAETADRNKLGLMMAGGGAENNENFQG